MTERAVFKIVHSFNSESGFKKLNIFFKSGKVLKFNVDDIDSYSYPEFHCDESFKVGFTSHAKPTELFFEPVDVDYISMV